MRPRCLLSHTSKKALAKGNKIRFTGLWVSLGILVIRREATAEYTQHDYLSVKSMHCMFFLSQCKVWTLYLEALKKKCFEWQCAPSFVLLLRPEDHKSLIQNTEEIKRTLFNETKQDKTCTFLRKSSFFKLRTTKKQKNRQWIQLILCQLEWGRLAEGKGHETDRS